MSLGRPGVIRPGRWAVSPGRYGGRGPLCSRAVLRQHAHGALGEGVACLGDSETRVRPGPCNGGEDHQRRVGGVDMPWGRDPCGQGVIVTAHLRSTPWISRPSPFTRITCPPGPSRARRLSRRSLRGITCATRAALQGARPGGAPWSELVGDCEDRVGWL